MSTDFQLVPTTDDDSAPLDTEPIGQDTVPAPTTTPAARPEPALDHTPGGLPAIPLAVIASNTTIAGLSAAAIVAGPLGAAAAGAVALGGVVAVRASASRGARRRTRTVTAARKAAGTRSASASSTGRTGTTRSGSGVRKAGSTLGSTGTKKRTARTTAPSTARVTAAKKTGAGKPAGSSTEASKKQLGRVGQVKALRKAKTAATPTRKERRSADTAARRGLKDARRDARRTAKTGGRTLAGARGGVSAPTGKTAPTKATTKPAAGRTAPTAPAATSPAARRRAACTSPVKQTRTSPLGRLRTRAQDRTDQARTQARGKLDQAVESRRDRIKNARKAAKSRAILGRRVAASATRYGLAAAGRALVAAPVGALGMLTTPIGRKLGWSWLQYPGRRLYRRLITRAKTAHEDRVRNARKQHEDSLNTLDPEVTAEAVPPIADTVDRAPGAGHAPTLTGDPEVSEEIHSHFLDQSSELESAARAYEPGGMMHVRTTIRSMGPAIEHWANAFAALAEKADEDFPVGVEIGEGLDVIHRELRKIVDHAESLAEDFDRVHESDIARLLNPRKSLEAEKEWDIRANEDFTE